MKKFINQVDDIVPERLEGLTLAFLEILKKLPDCEVVVRSEFDENNVSLISGGGSGYESAHAGYVGWGMLDAAIVDEDIALNELSTVGVGKRDLAEMIFVHKITGANTIGMKVL